MKSFKLVLSGIAILMCSIWGATKKHGTIKRAMHKTNMQRDSSVKNADAEILMHPFCIPVNMRY